MAASEVLTENINVSLEACVLEAIISISQLALMPVSNVINKLIIDGLRYEYGLKAYLEGRQIIAKKGD